jgi:hypothetical protein
MTATKPLRAAAVAAAAVALAVPAASPATAGPVTAPPSVKAMADCTAQGWPRFGRSRAYCERVLAATPTRREAGDGGAGIVPVAGVVAALFGAGWLGRTTLRARGRVTPAGAE